MPEPAMLDYFYGDEAEQYTFYRIPKVLFTDPAYRRISSDAKTRACRTHCFPCVRAIRHRSDRQAATVTAA